MAETTDIMQLKYKGESVYAKTHANAVDGLQDAVVLELGKNKRNGDSKNYISRYVDFENVTGIEEKQIAQIKMMFEIGELKSDKCIRIFKDNTEIPFQFSEVDNENFAVGTNETYYSDGSVRACTLYVYDWLTNDARYEVRIYDDVQEYDYVQSVTVDSNSITVTQNDNVYEFLPDNYNLQKINNKVFTDDSRVKIGGSTLRIRTFDVVNSSIEGTGVIFIDVVRELMYKNELLLKQTYRIFLNGRIEVTLKTLTLTDTVAGYIESVYNGFNTIPGEVTVTSSGEYFYIMKNDDATYGVSPIFTNGNVQRDSTTLPVYPTKIYTSFRTDINTLVVGWDYFGSKTYPISKGTFFSSRYVVDLEYNDNTKISQYVNNVSVATNRMPNEVKKMIKQDITEHIDHLKSEVYKRSSTDYYNLAYPFCVLYDYVYTKKYYMSDVVYAFDQTFNKKFTGETTESFADDYKNGLGLHISGRFIQVAYLIYNEMAKIKDTRTDRFKNICINYAKFISDLWIDNNEIPMVYKKGATNNGRATALSCLAIGITLYSDENMKKSYTDLSDLISKATRVNTILPDGNLSTSRYLHYSAFAMYELSKASSLVDTTITNLSSYTNNIVDCVHATGQIKDMTYCCSDSRRGLSHTYAYSLGTLLLKGNYGELELSHNMLKWYTNQNYPFGGQAFPLDHYDYNPSQTQAGSMPFELIALIELLLRGN